MSHPPCQRRLDDVIHLFNLFLSALCAQSRTARFNGVLQAMSSVVPYDGRSLFPNNLQIGFLVDHPDFVPEVARILYDEWGQSFETYDGVGSSLELEALLRSRFLASRESLPLTLVAFFFGEDGQRVFCGTVSMEETDNNPTYDHLTPWMTCLAVPEPYRNRGIAHELIRHLVQVSVTIPRPLEGQQQQRQQPRILYLSTKKQREMYEKLGWTLIEVSEEGESMMKLISL